MSERIQTHSEECWRFHGHSACAERKVKTLTDEIERLRAELDARPRSKRCDELHDTAEREIERLRVSRDVLRQATDGWASRSDRYRKALEDVRDRVMFLSDDVSLAVGVIVEEALKGDE